MKYEIASFKIVKGRHYQVAFVVDQCPVQIEFHKHNDFLAYAEILRNQGVPDVDRMIQQVNPIIPVYYCTYAIDGRTCHHVANDRTVMIQKLIHNFALFQNKHIMQG